jgi:hypothetical protein
MNTPSSSTRTYRFWLLLAVVAVALVIVTALTTARWLRPTKVASSTTLMVDPSTFTTADLRGKLTGAFSTPPGSRLDLTFMFNYPQYELGASTTTVWTSGTSGTWDIDDSHPLLTPAQRAQGWHMMLITPPGETTTAPSRVLFTFDADGQITAIEFASFLGIEAAPAKHMFLYRKNLP